MCAFFNVAFLMLTSIFSSPSSARSPVPPSGLFLKVSGLVEIKNSNGEIIASSNSNQARKIFATAPFYEGETIITGSGGSATIQFVEGKNEVLLGPNTTLVIQKAPNDPRMKRGTKLFLDSGFIDSKVKQKYSGKDGDEYSIATKTVVAGVRGTEFQVAQNNQTNETLVTVYSGKVSVKSLTSNQELLLKAGEKVSNKKWEIQKILIKETNQTDTSSGIKRPL